MSEASRKGRYDNVEMEAVRRLVGEVHAFHGQRALAILEGAIGAKKPSLRILFWFTRALASWRLANALMLAGVVLIHPALRKIDGEPCGFAFGLSANNQRAFDRLRAVIASADRQRLYVNGRSASIADRGRVLASWVKVWSTAGILADAAQTSPLVHIQSVIACAVFIAHRVHRLPPSTRVICVANDHAPACLGVLAAARLQEVRTCYIQHAPVTEYFPPLSFDLSILYDRSSVLAYEKAASAKGGTGSPAVAILSPFDNPFRRPGPVPIPMRIGVCLSLLLERQGLEQMLTALSRHPNVAAILLRPHPRCQAAHSRLLGIGKVAMQPIGMSAAAYFESVDLVLAPNSGIIVEALHSGRPTFYTPQVDKVGVDYYGFAQAGIVPVFNISDLDCPNRLSEFFDDAWISRYSAYDETVSCSSDEAGRKVAAAFESLMNS